MAVVAAMAAAAAAEEAAVAARSCGGRRPHCPGCKTLGLERRSFSATARVAWVRVPLVIILELLCHIAQQANPPPTLHEDAATLALRRRRLERALPRRNAARAAAGTATIWREGIEQPFAQMGVTVTRDRSQ